MDVYIFWCTNINLTSALHSDALLAGWPVILCVVGLDGDGEEDWEVHGFRVDRMNGGLGSSLTKWRGRGRRDPHCCRANNVLSGDCGGVALQQTTGRGRRSNN